MTKKLIGAATALVVMATAASAQQIPDPIPNPDNADQAAAIYRIDGVCVITINGERSSGDVFYVQSTAQGATNPSILVCKGETDQELDRPIMMSGYQCFTPFGMTTDSRRIVSTSGKWTSVCNFRD